MDDPLLQSLRLQPDGRLLITDPALAARRQWLYVLDRKLAFDGVAGVPNNGTQLAKEFVHDAYNARVECSLLAFPSKKQGDRHLAPLSSFGNLEKGGGSRVLIIDDIARTGEHLEEAVELARMHFKVTDCLVLVDSGLEARERLKDLDVTLHALGSIAQLRATCPA